MKYIFCPSYDALFFALHLKNSGHEIKIITDNTSVKKFCGTAGIDCIYYNYIGVPTPEFYKMFTLKRRMDNLIKRIDIKKDDDFYLLDYAFDISAFYLAKEWAKRGNAYFHVLNRCFDAYKETGYLNLSLLARTSVKYLLKVFLGLDLVFFDGHGKPVYGVDDRFIEKNKIKRLSLNKSLYELQLEAMRKSPVKFREYDNLIGIEGNISDIIDEVSLIRVYEEILKSPGEFAIKRHPRVLKTKGITRYKNLFSTCEELPDYLPIELLFNSVRRSVISVASTSLISASQLEHFKAISLLELVKWKDQAFKAEMKTWLVKESNNRIIFVKTFEELKKLLEA